MGDISEIQEQAEVRKLIQQVCVIHNIQVDLYSDETGNPAGKGVSMYFTRSLIYPTCTE